MNIIFVGVRVSSSSLFHVAAIAQLVERDLAKVEVAGPSPVCRSFFIHTVAAMVELVDTRDLKSLGQKWPCGFESRSRHYS